MSKELEELSKSIEKSFGKGLFFRVGDNPVQQVEVISSGSMLLDSVLGGGFAKGRIVEIYGPESSGKTTLALSAIAQAQKEGNVAFIDVEQALDVTYAEQLGVDVDNLWITQPDYGEQALEILDKVVSSGKFSMVVVDSVAALTPKAELEGEMGDSKMGLHARLMSQACRKLVTVISKTNTTVIFINQLRMKIGVVFGNPEVTTGGNALKFYCSQRLDVRRGPLLKKGEEAIGHTLKVKVVKNKIAPPLKRVETKLIYGKGISYSSEVLDLALQEKVVVKSGSWFKYKDESVAQGEIKMIDLLDDNHELREEILDEAIANQEQ